MKLQNSNIKNHFKLLFNKNISFPNKPMIIEGVSIYEMPNSVGLIFRGGVKKISIKGRKSKKIWDFIKINFNGINTLNQIIEKVISEQINPYEFVSFTRIIHANHLIKSKQTNSLEKFNSLCYNQEEHYKKLSSITMTSNLEQIKSDLNNEKILLICDSSMSNIAIHMMNMHGIKNIGLLYFGNNQIEKEKLLVCQKLKQDYREQITENIHDFTTICIVVNNPVNEFINNVTEIGIQNKQNVIYLTHQDNNFIVGPYLSSNSDTSCYNCFIMRSYSYNTNSLYDFLYDYNIEQKNTFSNNEIKGYDVISFKIAILMLIGELTKIITKTNSSSLINKVIEINSMTSIIKYKQVDKVPHCPYCDKSNRIC